VNQTSIKAPAILLMGPTASGKTSLAIRLAQELGGEIISVDSALVYRGMDIGTAKPAPDQQGGIPHHLIDILDPLEAYSTGQFHQDAEALMGAISDRGRIPILAGGTMLYFHGLSQGLATLPPASPALREAITAEAQRLGWDALHRDLQNIDPVAAARIHPKDPQRIQRALEVFRLTGIPLTTWIKRTQHKSDRPLIKLVLRPGDRAALYQRIEGRFLAMLEQGLIEEVARLFDRGDLHADLPALRAVGYRQVWSYLEGAWSREAMIERALIATRQFAKRQMTWLQKETEAQVLFSEEPQLLDRALSTIREQL
jgi:tRNA dimethylallyltransferase